MCIQHTLLPSDIFIMIWALLHKGATPPPAAAAASGFVKQHVRSTCGFSEPQLEKPKPVGIPELWRGWPKETACAERTQPAQEVSQNNQLHGALRRIRPKRLKG